VPFSKQISEIFYPEKGGLAASRSGQEQKEFTNRKEILLSRAKKRGGIVFIRLPMTQPPSSAGKTPRPFRFH
jgi:hypothetical protein